MSSMGSLEALSAVLRDSKTGLSGISTYAAGLGGASHGQGYHLGRRPLHGTWDLEPVRPGHLERGTSLFRP